MITVTPAAAAQIKALLADEQDAGIGIRFGVRGGGCAGFEYVFGFDHEADDDHVLDMEGLRIFVDPVSAPLVHGSEIAWSEQLGSYGFKINNPNAAGGCGCGKSFSAAERGCGEDEGCGPDGCTGC